jgi:hypothetical protein
MYDDAECWTSCPHGPLYGAQGAYSTANPNGYCKRCDLVGPHHCIEQGVPAKTTV